MAFKYFNVKNGLVTGNILLHAGNGVIAANTFNGNLSVTDSANLGNVGNVKITGGQANYVLRTDGTGNLSWVEQSGGNSQVAGSNTQVQFNNNGNFSGSNSFTFDSFNTLLTVNNFAATSSANLGNVANVKVTGGSNGYYLQTDGTGNLTWSSVVTGITLTVDSFVGDGSNVQFTLTQTPQNANYTIVSIGGVMQPKSAYTVVNNTLTFGSAPPETSPIEVTIFEAGGGGGGGASEFNGNVTGNLNVAGTTFVTGDIIPTSNNIVNIGSPTNRFGTLYLAANTIDLGGTTISTTPTGDLSFATSGGNFGITANTVNFLNTIATTAIEPGAPVQIDVLAAGANTQIQFNDDGQFSGNSGLTFNKTTQTLSANFISGNGNGLSNINGANISGAVANATYADTASIVTTPAQSNITSVGTLTTLTIGNATSNSTFGNGTITASGNISFTGANVSLGAVGNLKITGGTNGYFLKTDGTGNLSWDIASGGGGGTPGGTDTQVQFNDANSFAGNTGFTFNKVTGVFSAPSLSVTGNANLGNLGTSRVIATGNISGTQLISNIATGTAPLVVTSTTVVANLRAATANTANTANTVTTNAQPNITSVGSLTTLTVTGNANVGNLGTAGLIVATGNITGGNLIGVFANGNSSISIPSVNGNINISAGGTVNEIVITSTGINVTGTLNATGNGTFANIEGGNIVTANFVQGTLTTAAQPNITSVGTLTGLTVSGTSNLGSVSNLRITGGTANFVLSTDGAGNLSWKPQTGVANIPPNNQTAAYVLVASDVGKYINITTGGVTVPSGVFSSGDTFSIYNNSASNQTITQGVGVTIYQVGTAVTGNRTLAQRGLATLLCVGSNEFVITGGGLT